jgi:hypothetical protein
MKIDGMLRWNMVLIKEKIDYEINIHYFFRVDKSCLYLMLDCLMSAFTEADLCERMNED